MKLRTLLLVVVVLAALFPATEMFRANREILRQRWQLGWGGADVSVSTILLLLMLASMAFVSLVGLSRDVSRLMDRRRQKRQSRRQDEIEEEYSRGVAALVEGREEEALGHFRAVLERDSRHFNTLLKLGEVLRLQGRHSEAIEFHRKAHHLKEEDNRPLYALVDDYEAKGEMDRARAVLGKIIGLNKQSVAAWRKLRDLHLKERSWDKAWEAHERIEKLAPTGGAAREADRRVGRGIQYELAADRLEKDRFKEATAMLRRLIKDDPLFVPGHIKLGEALRREGRDTEAVEAWFQGFEATSSPILLTVLEEHFMEREQPMAAIEALKRCVGRARKDTIPRFYLGKLYFRLEMLDDAMAVLSPLQGRASYAPTLHYFLGRIHERRRQHAEAAAEYRKVIKEMELVQIEYRCRACGETSTEWMDRCPACGEWNTIEVNFREEISLDELGLSPAPVYTAGD